MALDLHHQTAGEFSARFWQAVRDAHAAGDKLRYHRLVWWIWTRIQAGDLTSDQVRTSYNAAFGKSLSPSQWSTFVTDRLVPMKDRYLALLAEGEL